MKSDKRFIVIRKESGCLTGYLLIGPCSERTISGQATRFTLKEAQTEVRKALRKLDKFISSTVYEVQAQSWASDPQWIPPALYTRR